MEQRTPEWFAARLGKVTASRIADLTARTKSGYGASRANYLAELVTERLTGQPAPSYENAAMIWGAEQEPNARATYEFQMGVDVLPVGFVVHPAISMAGASPDGLIGTAGLLEIKAPNTATHIDTLLNEAIPGKYIKQIQWQLACAEREWCDYVSYDPRLGESMRFFVKRVPRDDVMIKALEKEVREFLQELECTVETLRQKYEPTNILAAG